MFILYSLLYKLQYNDCRHLYLYGYEFVLSKHLRNKLLSYLFHFLIGNNGLETVCINFEVNNLLYLLQWICRPDQPTSSYSEQSLASITSHDECFRSQHHAETSLSRMESYLLKSQLTDVTLIAGLLILNNTIYENVMLKQNHN